MGEGRLQPRCVSCAIQIDPQPAPFFFESQRHGMSSEEFCSAYVTIQALGIALQAALGERRWQPRICGTASGDAVPHGVRHRRSARRGPTVRRQELSPIKGSGTPKGTPRTIPKRRHGRATGHITETVTAFHPGSDLPEE